MTLRQVIKPPFRTWTMAEVASARGSNGLRAVSTFSGCGGGCLGLEMAGYEVLVAAEFIPAAREVYAANHPGVPIEERDIRQVQPEDLLKLARVEAYEVDLLEGSPPCSSFSLAGRREEGWGETKAYSDGVSQRTDDLFWEFARLLRGIKPRAFIAENVAGLARGVAKGYFKEIHKELTDCGYVVEARMLNAQWLGVAQKRERVIFVGVRNDLAASPVFPAPLPYRYSLREALSGLSEVASLSGRTGPGWSRRKASVDEPMATVIASDPAHTRYEVEDVLTPTVAKQARIAELDEPAPTILATDGGWSDVAAAGRKLTIAELRRVCGFPDDFVLTGTYAQQWERLGRAVPPPVYYEVGRALAPVLLRAKADAP